MGERLNSQKELGGRPLELVLGWVLLAVVSFISMIILTCPKQVGLFKRVLAGVVGGVALAIPFIFLTYIALLPSNWVSGLPFLDWVLPYVWALFSIYSWRSGESRQKRYLPVITFMSSWLPLFGISQLNWPWAVVRLIVLGLFVSALLGWFYPKSVSKPPT